MPRHGCGPIMRILAGLWVMLFAGSCSTPPTKHTDLSSAVPGRDEPVPSAQAAKEAIIMFIRAHPEAFIGQPDADQLAALPLVDDGEGKFHLGAFVIEPGKSAYSAVMGADAPEVYFYSGAFWRESGEWVPSKPELLRAHHLR